jgi:hypothetical protein
MDGIVAVNAALAKKHRRDIGSVDEVNMSNSFKENRALLGGRVPHAPQKVYRHPQIGFDFVFSGRMLNCGADSCPLGRSADRAQSHPRPLLQFVRLDICHRL